MLVRVFGMSLVVTAAALVAAYFYGGTTALTLAAILGVLEVSLSFDNAVINATVLERMSAFWQRIFLTIGILIAVFGMRLLFPLLIVSITAHVNPVHAFDIALHPPADGSDHFDDGSLSYQRLLEAANPKIAAFGGAFLLMLFFDFVFDERELTWLSWLERPLSRFGRIKSANVVATLLLVLITGGYITPDENAAVVMASGTLGLITYVLVDGSTELFGGTGGHVYTERIKPTERTKAIGRAGLFLFLYLELLDASFSLD